MKDQYEGERWADPNNNPDWMWQGTYNSPTQRWLDSSPGKLRYNPQTGTYQVGYNDPRTNQWKWGYDPNTRFGGGAGPTSGAGGAGAAAGGPSAVAGPAAAQGSLVGGTAGTAAGGQGTMGWIIPAASAAASLYSTYKNSNAQKDAAKNQADLYNNWLKLYQDTSGNLMNAATQGGWNPFGPKITTTSGGSSSQGGASFNNRPEITGEYQGIDQLMRNIMTGRLSSPSSLPAGYASNQARAINESYAGADQAARNMAASRGLSGEQAYAVASPANRARAGALADMRGNIPLLERQMQNEDIGISKGLQQAFGTGQAGVSSNWNAGQNQGQTTSPFNANDLSTLMSVLMPPGPQQSGMTGTSTSGQMADSLGALLGYLASQQQNRGGYGSAGPPPGNYGYG